ncbi:FAD-binding domain-containing protein [Penicillium macrosclerotiorum]|uniref:FAD-binding domain-containing protein n=1 Tax=Penicillium macrosclerotiorum TaxID=303699 RepID=UPI0025473E74|nr:FAD-binding domain-containing protein [Penicillium macrosclerotiorum]KAJ5682619.1 FAD-binding domain-containing protein [Penicillium macrosclerotiorum]
MANALSHVQLLIHAGLESQVLLPSDPEYATRQASDWSKNAQISPGCILRSKSAEEVSTALQALATADQKFAISSSGHTQYAGTNSIKGGVTIDLDLLNWTHFDGMTETVQIGPENRWKELSEALQEHGRVGILYRQCR